MGNKKVFVEDVMEILYELQGEVQWMRDEGETDLRSVLNAINTAIWDVKKLD